MRQFYISLVGVLICSGCLSIVKNRRFEGVDHVVDISQELRIRTPKMLALGNSSNRDYWDSQEFTLYIPITTYREKDTWKDYRIVEKAISSGLIEITNIRVYLHGVKSTLKPEMGVWADNIQKEGRTDLIPGKPAFEYPQGLFGESDYTCVFAENIYIPAEEDTITVSFDVNINDTGRQTPVHRQLSFTLWREEGKKLFFDPGR